MGEDGRRLRPADPRPRLQVPLEVVGVELDEARREKVAAAVLGPGRHARAGVDRGDPAVVDGDAAGHRLGLEDDPGVGQHQLRCCGVRRSCGMGLLNRAGTTMGDWRRHAIYFAPPEGSALARASGRTGSAGTPRRASGAGASPCPGCRPARELVEAPRRYGFQAMAENG